MRRQRVERDWYNLVAHKCRLCGIHFQGYSGCHQLSVLHHVSVTPCILLELDNHSPFIPNLFRQSNAFPLTPKYQQRLDSWLTIHEQGQLYCTLPLFKSWGTTTHPYRPLTGVCVGFPTTEDKWQWCLVHVGDVSSCPPSQWPNLLSFLGSSVNGSVEVLNCTSLVIRFSLTAICSPPFTYAMPRFEPWEPTIRAAEWCCFRANLRKNLLCASAKPPSLDLQPFLT